MAKAYEHIKEDPAKFNNPKILLLDLYDSDIRTPLGLMWSVIEAVSGDDADCDEFYAVLKQYTPRTHPFFQTKYLLTGIPHNKGRGILSALGSRSSFFKLNDEFLILHEDTRKLILDYYWSPYNDDVYREAFERIINYYESKLLCITDYMQRTSYFLENPQKYQTYFSEYLDYLLRIDQNKAFTQFKIEFKKAFESWRYDYADLLLTLMERHCILAQAEDFIPELQKYRAQLEKNRPLTIDSQPNPKTTMSKTQTTRLLILCKTYPSPSAKYTETSCVAAMTEEGKLIRIYPVPFRLVDDAQQFKKWQWVTAKIEKTRNDNRAESHRIYVDTIQCEGDPLPTKNEWAHRRFWLDKLPLFTDFEALESARQQQGFTLALLKPDAIAGLDITPVTPDWTEDEKAKLLREQIQGNLFAKENEERSLQQLRKLPFDFHYRYRCNAASGPKEYRHKIVDWEAGALYWNVARQKDWEDKFRQRYEREFAAKDLHFLMGTIHRFPHQWLIISVIYPPKQKPEAQAQGSLF